MRNVLLFGAMGAALAAVGFLSSWTEAVSILNLCLISALMALGVNMQWGYAGLFNVGIMGFAALGGVAAVLVSMPPVAETWAVGGAGIGLTVLALIATVAITLFVRSRLAGRARAWATFACVVIGYFAIREVFDPAVDAIEATDAARTGYLGGLGLPIMLAWVVGGLFAAGAAWIVGKIALGLRADYLAIATLGISEIIVALLKNEDWLSRGVKNVTALPRPVPYEVDLQAAPWFNSFAAWLGGDVISLASIFVQLSYGLLFTIVLLIVLWFAERALKSPWGRMMRAIRDNRDAAAAMGKNVTKRHLQVFVLGSAVVGLAGAMMTTLDGQFTPGSYQPLRFTFLIWVMVIVGGSGNNWGSILGGFLIWFLWIEAEPVGRWLTASLGDMLPADSPIRAQLIDAASYLRPLVMGTILLLVLRFSPKGLIPEKH
ncbi:branched-chain amino acid ABC transporter permease [Abyssibius alkaniclasticus]|uniref:branched-chain amino acid ABC transporter permease n=1 Tax=Abyssibius alkaniclasticus TaxID=2881234 RepID=UPI0023639C59|nr:branched-chain amino acid ABC transporter permease [Abyssibius alkaniclasticus]UPH70376.1 branched-chain amino acid ABC transporter permease [Abyssibius alkaniclasticus]